MKSRCEEAKNVFVDSVDLDDYIELDTSLNAYKQLCSGLEKPLKMILLFGRPGTGKSILLNYLHRQLRESKEIYLFDTPAMSEKEFFYKMFKIITGKKLPAGTEVNFSALVEYCKRLRGKREIVILLDEAQMYGPELMEKIRLLSDSRAVKFVVSLHKTDNEDVIAKEHFQSRIWEVVELNNATLDDLSVYIHKKLLKRNLYEVSGMLKPKHLKAVYEYTGGNYRECNKFMFVLFGVCEYFEKHKPNEVQGDALPMKIIEMAAIKLGYIDA